MSRSHSSSLPSPREQYQFYLLKELLTCPARKVEFSHHTGPFKPDQTKRDQWTYLETDKTEEDFAEFLKFNCQNLLGDKVSCELNIAVQDSYDDSPNELKRLRCQSPSSIVAVGFRKSSSVLPFFIEVRKSRNVGVPHSEGIMEMFTRKVIRDFQQTLVYSLSDQAYVHRVRYGINSSMVCLLVYPEMLFQISLSPAPQKFQWNASAIYVHATDSPDGYWHILENYCSQVLILSKTQTYTSLPWIPTPSLILPFFINKTNHGFVAKLEVCGETEEFLASMFGNRVLQNCQSHVVLKFLSSLLSFEANRSIRTIRLLLSIMSRAEMEVSKKIHSSPSMSKKQKLARSKPQINHPYLALSMKHRCILMRNVGEPLPKSIYAKWELDSKRRFFEEVCFTALYLSFKYEQSHNDIRCANITYDNLQGTFCLIDWDNSDAQVLKPAENDGRYPNPHCEWENSQIVFTTGQLLSVIFCLDGSVEVEDAAQFCMSVNQCEMKVKSEGIQCLRCWANQFEGQQVLQFLLEFFECSKEMSGDTVKTPASCTNIGVRCLKVLAEALNLEENDTSELYEYFGQR